MSPLWVIVQFNIMVQLFVMNNSLGDIRHSLGDISNSLGDIRKLLREK